MGRKKKEQNQSTEEEEKEEEHIIKPILSVAVALKNQPFLREVNVLTVNFLKMYRLRKAIVKLAKYNELYKRFEEILKRFNDMPYSEGERICIKNYIDNIPLFNTEELQELTKQAEVEANMIKVKKEAKMKQYESQMKQYEAIIKVNELKIKESEERIKQSEQKIKDISENKIVKKRRISQKEIIESKKIKIDVE